MKGDLWGDRHRGDGIKISRMLASYGVTPFDEEHKSKKYVWPIMLTKFFKMTVVKDTKQWQYMLSSGTQRSTVLEGSFFPVTIKSVKSLEK